MFSRFQAAALVASPSYPNSIAWSEENLIAVASGHIVTILNPELPMGPRGTIKVPAEKPFPIGVVEAKDLISGCLLPISLSRDREFVRSIAWSPLGMAPNSGCLLAICTIEGRVKLYRQPFCDYSAEWIEVVDISEYLFGHLARINFRKFEGPSSEISSMFAREHQNVDNVADFCPRGAQKRKRLNETKTIRQEPGSDAEQSPSQRDNNDAETQTEEPDEDVDTDYCDSEVDREKYQRKKEDNGSALPLITADQYASRSAMLSSLIVAWSPLLQSSVERRSGTELSSCFSVLAVGGKSGGISLWRIDTPKFYSIEHADFHPSVILIWLLQAHNSWVTALSWLLLSANSSTSQLLLASGSSDGSVRIWLGSAEDFAKPSEPTCCPLILLKEIVGTDTISSPVSVLSLIVPAEPQHRVLLAVGRGSGSIEVWTHDKVRDIFKKISAFDAHDHVVSGLAWAFDGNSLYSCSLDNFVRRWRLHQDSISEAAVASSTPGQRAFGYLPNAFYSCYGLAVSPGNLVLATVRSFNADLLNPMYEARYLKAAVEFFWIGGQQHNVLFEPLLESATEPVSSFPETEVAYWKSNLLWSLKLYENSLRPLVVWDVIAALLVFQSAAPNIVQQFLLRWLSEAFLESQANVTSERILSHMSKSFSRLTSRQLQLLNVICRRVALSELKPDQVKHGELEQALAKEATKEDESWAGLVSRCERELRERLVCYSLFACSSSGSRPEKTSRKNEREWHPTGLAQMEQWVAHSNATRDKQLKGLLSNLQSHKKRLHPDEYIMEEKCNYCSASVPFESPEVAFCNGLDITDGESQRHRLTRCAVSMQICPPTTPSWFCICCHRRAFKLAPMALFTMVGCPASYKSLHESHPWEAVAKPLCPFCGILMQRLQPNIFLSPAPV